MSYIFLCEFPGKSWLLNQLYGKDIFESDVNVEGVTTTLEIARMIAPDNSEFHLMNIPGLVEAKAKNIERNKKELKAALSKGGEYKLVFVFAGPGGRIQPKDVFAYKELCKGFCALFLSRFCPNVLCIGQ